MESSKLDLAVLENVPMERVPLDPPARTTYLEQPGLCNSRNAGTPDEAASSRGSSGIHPALAWPKNRAPAGCWFVFWNAVVLG
jgi:hypothetical protein